MSCSLGAAKGRTQEEALHVDDDEGGFGGVDGDGFGGGLDCDGWGDGWRGGCGWMGEVEAGLGGIEPETLVVADDGALVGVGAVRRHVEGVSLMVGTV